MLVAYSWSRATYFILDVPLHAVQAADRGTEDMMRDLEEQVRISCLGYRRGFEKFGVPALGVGCFALTIITTVGFIYGFRLPQAFAMLLWPHMIAAGYTVWFAYRISDPMLKGQELIKAFYRHRRNKQFFGFLAIFLMALAGVLLEHRILGI